MLSDKPLNYKVNTGSNEISPFYDIDNGVLYFSSDGHMTMGGLDVFSSKGELDKNNFKQHIGNRPVNKID